MMISEERPAYAELRASLETAGQKIHYRCLPDQGSRRNAAEREAALLPGEVLNAIRDAFVERPG